MESIPTPDIVIKSDGSVVLALPVSEAGKAWEAANVDPEASRFGDAFVIHHSNLEQVTGEMIASGLLVAEGGWL